MSIVCFSVSEREIAVHDRASWFVRVGLLSMALVAPMLSGCAQSDLPLVDQSSDALLQTPISEPTSPPVKTASIAPIKPPGVAPSPTVASPTPAATARETPAALPRSGLPAPGGAAMAKVEAPPPPSPIRIDAVWSGSDVGPDRLPQLTLTASRSEPGPAEVVRVRVALTLRPSNQTAATDEVSLNVPAGATTAQSAVPLPPLQAGDDDNSLIAEPHETGSAQAAPDHPSISIGNASIEFPSRETLAFAEASKDTSFAGVPSLMDYLDRYKTGAHRSDALRLVAVALESGPGDRCNSEVVKRLATRKVQFPAGHERAQATIAAREEYEDLRPKVEKLSERNLYAKVERFAQEYPNSECRPLIEPWLHESFWRDRATTPPAIVALADYYVGEGRVQSAIDALKPAMDARYMPALALAGKLMSDQGDTTDAAQALRAVAKSDSGADPADASVANYQLGLMAEQHNQPEVALRYLEATVRSDPNCAECFIDLGQVQFLLTADWNAERTDLEAAIAAAARAPGRWPGTTEKAKRLLQMHDTRS